MSDSLDQFSLRVFDRTVKVCCNDKETESVLLANYGEMQAGPDTFHLNYHVGRKPWSRKFFIRRQGVPPLIGRSDGEFLYEFEQDFTVQLQKLRRDLFFVHSAVLELSGRALMLAGRNKKGKSMTTWGLLHHGFRYLSDELAPIDPKALEVYPYPRALWLRGDPPNAYPLRANKRQTSWTLYIRPKDLPSEVIRTRTPLSAIFFLEYRPGVASPSLRTLSTAEAAARLLASTLNPGAHSEFGLDEALRLAAVTHCFELFSSDLSMTCAIIRDAFGSLLSGSTGPEVRS